MGRDPGELMRRHLPRLLLMGALLSPATLYALGLGEIRPHSALNQPFDAEIEKIVAINRAPRTAGSLMDRTIRNWSAPSIDAAS